MTMTTYQPTALLSGRVYVITARLTSSRIKSRSLTALPGLTPKHLVGLPNLQESAIPATQHSGLNARPNPDPLTPEERSVENWS
ncbi:hypothetical protein SCLCIDRAFT_32754 [Scleroderma citrinum Foug A]|uniref:Uncharacterized protein n=1 Tax=Scleroderma citrinum Foug A TaxID=1036808 RepID=A0A0C2YRC4_9AGAM|nr:hypothetical protein SCLCIDRAFT_32754 [Scleroderma citrinum Foug A]